MYNNPLQEALQKLNNMGGKPQKSLKESSNGPDSREEAFKCIRKLCDDASLAVKDSDIRNAIDTVCSYGDNFIRIDLICLDGGSAPGHFALHIPNGDKQIVFLIKDEDNPKISSRWDVRSMGPSEIEFLKTTRKNNDQLKFYHHEYQGMPARLSMDKKPVKENFPSHPDFLGEESVEVDVLQKILKKKITKQIPQVRDVELYDEQFLDDSGRGTVTCTVSYLRTRISPDDFQKTFDLAIKDATEIEIYTYDYHKVHGRTSLGKANSPDELADIIIKYMKENCFTD